MAHRGVAMETSDFGKNFHPASFCGQLAESRVPPLQCVSGALKGRMSLQTEFRQRDRAGDHRGHCSTLSTSDFRPGGVPTDDGKHNSLGSNRGKLGRAGTEGAWQQGEREILLLDSETALSLLTHSPLLTLADSTSSLL